MRIKIILLFTILITSSTFGTTHLVPSEYPTIQAAIDICSEGDTVLVAPGTYTGTGNRDLTFNGVNLVLLSEKGADSTILDIQGDSLEYHVAIHLTNGEDSTSVIDGFTFTNAYYNQWGYRGGALYFQSGVANVLNCNITNSALKGIFIDNSNSTPCRISNCYISGNRTGMYCGAANTIVDNCIIENNEYGGIEFFREMEIRNSLIAYNGGPGVGYSPTIGSPPVLLDHCTIVFNFIGFVYEIVPPKNNDILTPVDTATVRNCIIAFNTYAGIQNYFAEDNHYNCLNTNVYENGNFNWQNDKYSDGDEFGNVSVDPLFCDTANGNFKLNVSSYCANGNNPSGSTIGVYDVGCGGCCGLIRGNIDGSPDDIINISDLIYFIAYTFTGGPLPYCPIEMDVNGDGVYDIGDIVYLVTYMFFDGPEPVLCY